MLEHETTKLVQASTIACSSSAMLEQHCSTRSSSRGKPSVIWVIVLSTSWHWPKH